MFPACFVRAGRRLPLDIRPGTFGRYARSRHSTGIPAYPCYRTVEETYQTMDALAADHPTLAQVIDIGPTWQRTQNASQGYTMRVLRIGNSATDASIADKPNMVVTSSIHAREYAPAEVSTHVPEWLLDNLATMPSHRLVAHRPAPDPAPIGWPKKPNRLSFARTQPVAAVRQNLVSTQ